MIGTTHVTVPQSGLSYSVVRPTMIVGRGAPVLAGLAKLATLPAFLPIFGSGAVNVAPIHARDLAANLVEVLRGNHFANQTWSLGGPSTLTIGDLLQQLRVHRRGKSGRPLKIPIAPVRSLLSILEPVLLPILPLTAGQLATFANHGVGDRDLPDWMSRPATDSDSYLKDED